ncbi:MAG: DUF2892 domain-containing protein [Bacteroidia bacterium]
MIKNMGSTDKVIRLLIAIVVAILYFSNVISGVLGIVLLILSIVFVLTSLIGFCPLYTIFGFKTNSKDKE